MLPVCPWMFSPTLLNCVILKLCKLQFYFYILFVKLKIGCTAVYTGVRRYVYYTVLYRSLGVLLYTLVYGAMPFDGSNFKRLVKQITTGDYYEPKQPSSKCRRQVPAKLLFQIFYWLPESVWSLKNFIWYLSSYVLKIAFQKCYFLIWTHFRENHQKTTVF